MSDEKASPGPWQWKTDLGFAERATLVDRDGNQVCDFGGGLKWEESAGTPPEPADTALIADAPAMLELLQRVQWAIEDSDGTPPFGPTLLGDISAMLDKHGRAR